LWLTRHRPRTDRLRAGIVLWGGWLVVNGLVFSYASGIIHPYYTVALAPPIAALVGIGGALLWRTRRLLFSRAVLAATLVLSAWWTVQLLDRASSWHPELPWLVYGLTVVAVAGLFLPLDRIVARRIVARRRAAKASLVVAGAAVLSLLIAPGAYALQTAATTHSGALPTAGPASARSAGGGPGGFGARVGGFGRGANAGGTGTTPGGVNGGPGTTNGGPRTGPGANAQGGVGPVAGGRGGFGGGALNGMSVSAAVKSALEADAGRYTWAAAAVSSNEAGSLELGTGTAVMALGGFNGTDPAISLAAFEKLVAAGKIHYFYGSGNGSFIGSTRANTSQAYQIQQWVVAHYPAATVGTATLYDLSAAPTG
jgi:4-amino-4-deoxy-L-arabinose transferase-like glycosyltransferase